MGTRWRGMLAPLDTSTGDGRRFLSSGVTNRPLPLPLKWQRADVSGHDDSVIIGSCEQINYGTVDEAIAAGWIDAKCVKKPKFAGDLRAAWGQGRLFTEADPQKMPRLAEDIAEATLLLENGVVGPSVDAGAAEMVIAKKGCDEALSDEDLDQLFWGDDAGDDAGDDVELEMLFTEYQIAAATLVGIPAFAECRPFELIRDDAVITAAVRKTGWDTMPIADRDLEWDGGAAEKRVADDAGIGGESADWDAYAQAFLYVDDEADAETKAAYGFQIVDIIDGTRRIVPRAVFAVAGVLEGARGGTTIPEADQDQMRSVVSDIYARMADLFTDPTIQAPWDVESASILTVVTAAASTPTYDPAWFDDPKLSVLTPLTVTDDGRVYGHIATHDVCHVGDHSVCVTAPVSATGYGSFHRYTPPGVPVPVGRITVGHGQFACTCNSCRGSNDDHACVRLSAGGAIGHHDRLSTAAWVCAGEDSRLNAIWVAGVVSPTASVSDLASLTAGRVSGDWRPMGNDTELVEVLSLSRERPGFPLPRVRTLTGQAPVLTAAGVVRPGRPVPDAAGAIDLEHLAELVAGKLATHMSAGVVTPVRDPVSDGDDAPDSDPDGDADVVDDLIRVIDDEVTIGSGLVAARLFDTVMGDH